MIAGKIIKAQVANKIIGLPFNIKKLGLTIDVIKPCHFHDVAIFSSKIFSKEEPLCSYSKVSQSEYYQLTLETLKHPDNASLSIEIRNQSSDIVASCICEHVELGKFQKEIDSSAMSSSVYKILKLIQRSRIFYNDYYKKNNLSGNVEDFFMGSVSKEWRGKQLLTYLLLGASIAGITKGYSRAITEETNLFSQRELVASGMKVLTSFNYADFKVGEEKIFENIDEVFTNLINSRSEKKYSHTAHACNLVEASLEEILMTNSKKLKI